MIFTVVPLQEGTITIKHHPAPHEFKRLITQTGVTATIGPFGYFLQQQEEAVDTMIAKYHFQLHEPVQLEYCTDKPVIILCYALEGKIVMEQAGHKDVHYTSGEYHMYYLPAGRHQVRMLSGTCTLLNIELSHRKLKVLTAEAPVLHPLLQLSQEFSTEHLRLPEEAIDRDIRRITESINSNQDEGGYRKFFMESCVIQLLRHYMEALGKNKKYNLTDYHFTEEDLEKIREGARLMVQPGYIKMPLKELFEIKLKISYHKAQAGFKKIFRIDIRTARAVEKVALACDLLLQTDKTVEEIAFDLEYENASSLTKIFRKYRGCTPTEFRKLYRQHQE